MRKLSDWWQNGFIVYFPLVGYQNNSTIRPPLHNTLVDGLEW
jgi:hypothetical protein